MIVALLPVATASKQHRHRASLILSAGPWVGKIQIVSRAVKGVPVDKELVQLAGS